MPAEVISLCEYRKEKHGKEKCRDEKGRGRASVHNIEDQRRLRASREHVESLKGRGFPEDMHIGPDEPGEDFNGGLFSGLLGVNLSLDNPDFPYALQPKKKDMDWVKGIIEDEGD